MNKEQYDAYQTKVADFFQRECISNLTAGHLSCPNCGPDTFTEEFKWDDDAKCPKCREDADCLNEHFIASSCDCCGITEQGMKLHATACNHFTNEIQEYTVCENCEYYAEYRRLDDTTMFEISNDDGGPRYVITVGHVEQDVRECFKWNGNFVHVLCPNWKIPVDSSIIKKIKELQ